MNILITGGAGFIGSHTTDALIQEGHHVRILDNLHPTIHPHGKPPYLHPQAEFIMGDVRDKQTWIKALEDIDAVYHLAAYQDYLTDFATFFHVNTVSTALLYEVLVENKRFNRVKKVIVAASQAVMGEGRYKCPACFQRDGQYFYPSIRLERQLSRGAWNHLCPVCDHELEWTASDETVINPCNQYALSKHSQEMIAIQLGKRYNIPSTVMRYSIVQGPRQSFYNAYSGAMRIFALALFFGREPLIFEDGRQVRDFINIQDVVRANLLVLEKSEADYQVFNVGGGIAWTVFDFYNAMQEVTGRDLQPVLAGQYRYGDTRHIFSDTAKLQALGWQPQHDVKESIRDYWEYLSGQDAQADILAYSEKQMKQLNVIRKASI
ncbi:NAD-dependent epimerase/dehydratase family protein [Desulfococcaceae bacterium HSG9]|nr:NAD-dependent epimerase/dehydratase family protein [Desulfococcaceae bacterium HSG9]